MEPSFLVKCSRMRTLMRRCQLDALEDVIHGTTGPAMVEWQRMGGEQLVSGTTPASTQTGGASEGIGRRRLGHLLRERGTAAVAAGRSPNRKGSDKGVGASVFFFSEGVHL